MTDIGPVSYTHLDVYKRQVNERYQFMKGQHEDLMEAKENLLKIIDELEVGMRKQFKEKFEEIKTQFDKVFKELFGGGKGTIELTDAEDILDAGINIISQPPGKKLQNMMQLSGGEKALTAISLLFAIQNLKPSPFCLLDEIEAALDGSNVVDVYKRQPMKRQSRLFRKILQILYCLLRKKSWKNMEKIIILKVLPLLIRENMKRSKTMRRRSISCEKQRE